MYGILLFIVLISQRIFVRTNLFSFTCTNYFGVIFKTKYFNHVGALYKEGDPRRDSGFAIFYMGINIGAFTATLLCGYLGEEIGWAYGFGAAGIGMLLGLIIFGGQDIWKA